MENLSKALIMAASVILGILILTLMIFLFNKMALFGKNTFFDPEKSRLINEFNSKLMIIKPSNLDSNDYLSRKDRATIGDLLSVINFANDYNQELKKNKEKDILIKVIVDGKDTSKWFDENGNKNNEYFDFVRKNTVELKFSNGNYAQLRINQLDNIEYDVLGKIRKIQFTTSIENFNDEDKEVF